MSDLLAEVFPERVELEVVDSEPRVTTMGAMAAFTDRGLILTVADAGAIESFPTGTKVRGSYGDHSGFCQFVTEVVETQASDSPDAPGIIRLQPPKQISTTQRRRFVRADVDMTIPCALLDSKNQAFLSAPGEVSNLGGGGLKMVIAAHPSLVEGSKLALAFFLPGSDPILVLGRVVQVTVDPEGPATIRLAFTSIDADSRERVERYAYRKLGGTAAAKLWSSGKITSTQPSPP
ncbi:MAG: hypothetical protein QOE07_2329 [Acidimicrobiaceae bacterium]|jgi:c-di-GMP-binding flagellar brake protein YcgR|nr:hypothetical protein [Acidimicrobiaceae bacterium]MDQ1393918.1 hypothetical protein [Acidimicrobiaceae bacterium]MDQ1398927.1 hypothetical protein [Acidimicrobiaceae bacterium]MDQ1413741.1 hypothetical protein [Acidimicrobiaceae bacterium]MDQ1415768.1 hypothetical protein [Acidimicrobiaceae bacterium]